MDLSWDMNCQSHHRTSAAGPAKDPISALTSVQRGQSSVALAANTAKENFQVPQQNGFLGGGDLGNEAKVLIIRDY